MAKQKAKANWKAIVIAGVAGLALVLSAGSIVRQVTKEDTKELRNSAFSVAAVTEDGKLDSEATDSLTSDKQAVSKLVSVEKAEGAKAQVFVHWYDEDGVFLSTVEVTDKLEAESAPEGADTFRVELVPEDEDGKISVFEKGDYLDLVTVTLKK